MKKISRIQKTWFLFLYYIDEQYEKTQKVRIWLWVILYGIPVTLLLKIPYFQKIVGAFFMIIMMGASILYAVFLIFNFPKTWFIKFRFETRIFFKRKRRKSMFYFP